jgi:hypothetical protein
MASTKYTGSFFPIRWFSLIDGGKLNTLIQSLLGSVEDNITATAGGTKAAAYKLYAAINRISVCANNTDSVLLPPNPNVGQIVQIINDGAANAQVFGANSDTIDGVATATGVVLSAANRSLYSCTGVTAGAVPVYAWRSQAGAKSS